MKKLTKYSIIFTIGVIILSSLYYSLIHNRISLPENTLEKSFSFSGAKIVSSEIYFWASLKNNGADEHKLEEISDSLQKELNVIKDDKFTVNVTKNEAIIKKEAGGFTGDNKVVNILYQLQKKQDSQNESYISLKVTEDLSSSGLKASREKALQVFKKYGIEPRINSCITGSYDGKLGYNQLNEVCAKVFKQADARKVEGMRDDKLISVSAYSPSINRFIEVNNKKVNLNLAIRYNSYEDKTYIWLATPVITIEY